MFSLLGLQFYYRSYVIEQRKIQVRTFLTTLKAAFHKLQINVCIQLINYFFKALISKEFGIS